MPVIERQSRPIVSINALSRTMHANWLERVHAPAVNDQKRHPSPYDKPWSELNAKQRKDCSRGTLATIQALNASGHRIDFIDEYSDPSPEAPEFIDPEVVK